MISWVADVLRSAGLKVVELDGWRTRGRTFVPKGIVWHHTATSVKASDSNVDRLLRDGRPDLAGPLSQLGLRRDGTFVVVAAGRANHNGYGTWGNDSIGIEAYNDGVGEPWPLAQVDAYVRGTAAICRFLGWGADRVKAHRETDPRRKIDPAGLDMDEMRRRVTAALAQGDDDDMDEATFKKWLRDVLNDKTSGRPFALDRISHAHNYAKSAALSSREAVAKITALTETIKLLAAGQGVDFDELRAVIEDAVGDALSRIKLVVDDV